jgi:hypothetical protein
MPPVRSFHHRRGIWTGGDAGAVRGFVLACRIVGRSVEGAGVRIPVAVRFVARATGTVHCRVRVRLAVPIRPGRWRPDGSHRNPVDGHVWVVRRRAVLHARAIGWGGIRWGSVVGVASVGRTSRAGGLAGSMGVVDPPTASVEGRSGTSWRSGASTASVLSVSRSVSASASPPGVLSPGASSRTSSTARGRSEGGMGSSSGSSAAGSRPVASSRSGPSPAESPRPAGGGASGASTVPFASLLPTNVATRAATASSCTRAVEARAAGSGCPLVWGPPEGAWFRSLRTSVSACKARRASAIEMVESSSGRSCKAVTTASIRRRSSAASLTSRELSARAASEATVSSSTVSRKLASAHPPGSTTTARPATTMSAISAAMDEASERPLRLRAPPLPRSDPRPPHHAWDRGDGAGACSPAAIRFQVRPAFSPASSPSTSRKANATRASDSISDRSPGDPRDGGPTAISRSSASSSFAFRSRTADSLPSGRCAVKPGSRALAPMGIHSIPLKERHTNWRNVTDPNLSL